MASLAGLQGKAAMRAAEKKAEGLLEPLLEMEEESDEEQSLDSTAGAASAEVKRTPGQVLKMALVSVGLVGGVAASAAAMILNPVTAVFVMGGILIANAPYAAFKEHRIVKLPALRALTNQLREDANDLEEEVDFLSEEINDLEPEALRAEIVMEDLREIADDLKFDADKFVSLVKENETLIARMRDNLRQRIVQDVLGIVVASDRDNDGCFSDVETKMLCLKITIQLQEYGVEFDEAKFTKVMGPEPSVQKTMDIMKRLIPHPGGDGPEDEEEDAETIELYDMFHVAGPSADQSLTLGDQPGGPAVGGSSIGGSTNMKASTIILRSKSSLGGPGGPQRFSLSVTKNAPSRKKLSVAQKRRARKRDKFQRMFGRRERSEPGGEEPSRKKRFTISTPNQRRGHPSTPTPELNMEAYPDTDFAGFVLSD